MLWLRGIVFSVLVPGVVAFCVPQAMRHGLAPDGWWPLGWILFGVGATIYTICLINFLGAGGTPAIFFTRRLRWALGEEPRGLVRTGLHRYSRNPMYVGVLMAIAGQAIVYRSWAMAIYAAAAAVLFHLVVVFLEEPHLMRARGGDYAEYRRQAARWAGMPGP